MKTTEQQKPYFKNNAKETDTISSLPISELKPFSKYPFKPYSDEKILELANSIKTQGLIVPILVRPIIDMSYSHEIVSGHNRIKAAKLVGLKEISCNVKNIDDDTATLLMIDSNLQQRESILPSEKAWAYKYKLEAIKSQGKRNDLTSRQVVGKLEMSDIVGKESNESGRQVQRFIRLTNLISPLLDKVDERKLAFIPAVELSYLSKDQQEWLYDILDREEHFGVSLTIATKLKGISRSGNLSYEKIDKIIITKNQELPKIVRISYKTVKDYFPKGTTPQEFEKVIKHALDEWFEKHPEKRITSVNKENTIVR